MSKKLISEREVQLLSDLLGQSLIFEESLGLRIANLCIFLPVVLDFTYEPIKIWYPK